MLDVYLFTDIICFPGIVLFEHKNTLVERCGNSFMVSIKKNNRNRHSSLRQQLATGLELPSNAFGGASQIELSSNREAVIDGCLGVLEYSENEILLNLGNLTVCFLGTSLCMKCMTPTGAIIEGNISSIQFK